MEDEMLVRLLTPQERIIKLLEEAVYHKALAEEYRMKAANEDRIVARLAKEAQRIRGKMQDD